MSDQPTRSSLRKIASAAGSATGYWCRLTGVVRPEVEPLALSFIQIFQRRIQLGDHNSFSSQIRHNTTAFEVKNVPRFTTI